ncbi:type II toxin-antitoxin system VapC family toxin [Candidatus Bathyarchaeota archaeon]|nr:type II toxin-antitoxin system VapC family toxin [Candidatus Bathyarchaeota archaeon]
MERHEDLVLDASVMVKWFSGEEDSEIAVEIRDKHVEGVISIVSPDLALYEVVNALRYNPAFNIEDLKRAVSDLMDIGVDFITPNREILEKSVENAFIYDLSVYDSYYLSLAQIMGLQVVTADEKFFERAKETRIVKILKNFKL